MKQRKALVLSSGGLDSILACKLLMNQGIEVTALSFRSYFFDTHKAQAAADHLGIPLMVDDISTCHLELVKRPKFGHGAGLNPCIDCHALMMKRGSEIAQEQGFDILATGEVLGQRPFSQNRRALGDIERVTGLAGRILRPLSAKLLPQTAYELGGSVERDQLLAILGRSRKEQLRLAAQWGITDYPTPAGGCPLTEKDFSAKLKDLLSNETNPTPNDFQLLRFGRHFWVECREGKRVHIILGRNKDENLLVERLVGPGDALIKREDGKGPTALVRRWQDDHSEALKQETFSLILQYAKNHPGKLEEMQWSIMMTERVL